MSLQERQRLPRRRQSVGYELRIGARKLHVGIAFYPDGRPGEVTLKGMKLGTEYRATLAAVARLLSLGLQHGTPLAVLAETLVGIEDPSGGPVTADPATGLDGLEARSLWDALGRLLAVVAEGVAP